MSMFKWSGKQTISDNDSPIMQSRKQPNASAPKIASDFDSFDHTFKGTIHTIDGSDGALAVFGNCAYENRTVKIICTPNNFQIIEEVTISKINKTEISYRRLTGITWDHANSEVKLDLSDSFVILRLSSSVEFEKELRLRLAKIASNDFKIPTPMYVGIFAGNNKPKPFQRKRPNLSHLPQGKLPPLKDMRQAALDLRVGSYRPCASGSSRRMQLANQHIYEGFNTFKLQGVRGRPDIVDLYVFERSLLYVMENKVVFKPTGEKGSAIEFLYDDFDSWSTIDHDGSSSKDSGVELCSRDGEKVFFAVTYIRDLKHTLEYYWNKHQTANNREPMLGSTHGRPIVSVSTLSGEVRSSGIPQGQTEVVDIDGIIARPGGKMAVRASSVSAIKGMMGSVEEPRYVPNQISSVARHWSKVVLHQGWLLKQGGAGVGSLKGWIKRYFVLYKTSQGHFLVYYADFTECPLFSLERNARNIVDLAKATYIRPGSEGADVPNHSFDIVTIEREWTLCAETEDNLQRWMKVLTHAVDEDVAILPDEEIIYKVKPKQDPSGALNATDYSTALKVSAHGVSVTTPNASSSSSSGIPDREVFFWVYTDFFKWSLIIQNEKPALSVNVFTDSTFQKKVEYQFRYKEAHKIATAIEFFIEKFMSVMHIRLELTDPDAAVHSVLAEPETKKALPFEESKPPVKEIDLLGFDDDLPEIPNYPSYTQTAVSPQSFDPFSSRPEPKQTDLLDAFSANPPSKQPDDIFASDPFGSDPFAAPATAPANGTHEDPFGADLFSTSFAATPTPQIVMLPQLSEMQLQQISSWWLQSIAGSGGPLYDDEILQIASKVEIRGSQARVTLFYRNHGDSAISSLKASIEDPNTFLRYELGAVDEEMLVGDQKQQQIMVECINAVHPAAALSFEYVLKSESIMSKRESSISLPLTITSFNEPLVLGAQDFLLRWNALVSPGQEAVDIFDYASASPAKAHKVLTEASKFSFVDGVVDTAIGVAGAATLRMGSSMIGEKVNIGCLLKIEINAQVGKVRISVRTTNIVAAAPIAAVVKSYLFHNN